MSSSRQSARRLRIAVALVTFLAASTTLAVDRDALLRDADAAFARRAEGADGIWAQAEPIASAVAGYKAALELAPDDVATRTKLMHAIFFQAEYHYRQPAQRKAAFDEGGENGRARVPLCAQLESATVERKQHANSTGANLRIN